MTQKITYGYKQLLADANAEIETLSVEASIGLVGRDDTVLVDLRDPRELERDGAIPGAFHCPRGMLEFRISNEPQLQNLSRPIVVYCKTSGRAALSVVAMQAMGFTNVVSLAGGFDAWAAEQRPIAKPREMSFE